MGVASSSDGPADRGAPYETGPSWDVEPAAGAADQEPRDWRPTPMVASKFRVVPGRSALRVKPTPGEVARALARLPPVDDADADDVDDAEAMPGSPALPVARDAPAQWSSHQVASTILEVLPEFKCKRPGPKARYAASRALVANVLRMARQVGARLPVLDRRVSRDPPGMPYRRDGPVTTAAGKELIVHPPPGQTLRAGQVVPLVLPVTCALAAKETLAAGSRQPTDSLLKAVAMVLAAMTPFRDAVKAVVWRDALQDAGVDPASAPEWHQMVPDGFVWPREFDWTEPDVAGELTRVPGRDGGPYLGMRSAVDVANYVVDWPVTSWPAGSKALKPRGNDVPGLDTV
jgi:hypothetical protein